MSAIRKIATRQYQRLVQDAVQPADRLVLPPQGWISTVRSALGMSGAQVARRLGSTRAWISRTEKAESSGSVTLKTMQRMAEAMGCRFVYAIVPVNGGVEDLILTQARKKAARLVAASNTQMALEAQALTKDQVEYEVERLARQMMEAMPPDFWEE